MIQSFTEGEPKKALFSQIILFFFLAIFIQAGSPFEIHFYRNRNFNYHIYGAVKIPRSCQTLAHWMQRDATSLINQKCVRLYTLEDCLGESYEVPAGNHSFLEYFNERTVSYRACDNDDTQEEYRLKLYTVQNFQRLLLDEEITEENCTTLYHTYWNRTSSVVTQKCVVLFSSPNCEENNNNSTKTFIANEGNYSFLGNFDNRLASFRSCDIFNATKDNNKNTKKSVGSSSVFSYILLTVTGIILVIMLASIAYYFWQNKVIQPFQRTRLVSSMDNF